MRKEGTISPIVSQFEQQKTVVPSFFLTINEHHNDNKFTTYEYLSLS